MKKKAKVFWCCFKMIRWLYLAVFFLLSVSDAKEIAMQRFDKQNHKIFEILADKVSAKDNVITASGNAILLNYDVYILADKVRYDTKTKEALLEAQYQGL